MDYTISYAVYGLLLVFVLFLTYKTIITRKDIGGGQVKFKQKKAPIPIIMNVILFVMVFLFPGIVLKLMIVAIGIYFIYANTEPIITSDKGIYHNARLDEWDNLKKWAYDDKKKSLNLAIKINGRDQLRILPVDISEKDRILKEIKKHKKK